MNNQTSGVILVAEDNEINQKLITTILAKSGFQYKLVVNGLEALSVYQQEPFELILMDCQMPKMDGIVATKEIRQYEKDNEKVRVPILALTANAMKGDKEKCLECGMDDFISKPFKRQDILNSINYWLVKERQVLDESNQK